MPNFKNQKTSTNGGSGMSSTAVFKCPICGNTDSRCIGTRNNEPAESAFRLMEKKPKTRNL